MRVCVLVAACVMGLCVWWSSMCAIARDSTAVKVVVCE
jgi:hypothetical protein